VTIAVVTFVGSIAVTMVGCIDAIYDMNKMPRITRSTVKPAIVVAEDSNKEEVKAEPEAVPEPISQPLIEQPVSDTTKKNFIRIKTIEHGIKCERLEYLV
jgi:hypothetical protein